MLFEKPLTFADKLKQAKQAQFVGRKKELQLFEKALTDKNRTSLILNLYGQGGVGKSTLLDAFRNRAEENGARFLYIDSPDLSSSIEIFKSQLGNMLSVAPTINPDMDDNNLFEQIKQIAGQTNLIIAIDTFEEAGDINRWLRESFLPRLPENCLVIISGRHPLTGLWQSQPEWHDLIQPMALDNFDHKLTSHYLQLNGITKKSTIEQIWLSTAGYPLALSLSLSLSINLTRKDSRDVKAINQSGMDITTTLTQRWLREIPDTNLRPLIEAACIIRIFNQNILEAISGKQVSDDDFYKLQSCSFIRKQRNGWSVHSIVRNVLEKELSQRNPKQHKKLRMRALTSLAHAAIKASPELDRPLALHEFFYLLGDSLVRAALYGETDSNDKAYLENADNGDIAALEQYMRDWRIERGTLANINIKLFDKSRNKNIQQQIISEPREPEFINIKELITLFPGAIRILRDEKSQIKGLTIVLPINRQSINYLKSQPVMKDYFTALTEQQTNETLTPAEYASNFFVRLIDTHDPSDNKSRSALFRDLASLLLRPARFITTTPLELYQSLLKNFGFNKLDLPPQYDFGVDRPSPFFELDLRGEKLRQHLGKLIHKHIGESNTDLPLDTLLATIPVQQHATPQGRSSEKQPNILLSALSNREREVALIAVEGVANCIIASRLEISEVTIKKHMGQIFKKLGVRNRSELIKHFWSQAN